MANITSLRRAGNTTRQVDEWIQQLFTEGSCQVVDHAHRLGNMANKHAEHILFGRLQTEHWLVPNVGRLKWDKETRTLLLLPF